MAIVGTAGNDQLRPGPHDGAVLVQGLAGDDTLSGQSDGSVTLDGGAGDDRLEGNSSDWATYEGATGAVRIDLSATGAQNVGGGQGSDTLDKIAGVIGSAYGDTLTTGTLVSGTLMGRGGNDLLQGGDRSDFLWGGDGADTLSNGNASFGPAYQDFSYGQAGDDVIYANVFTEATGGDGADRIEGSARAWGGSGNDTIVGGALPAGGQNVPPYSLHGNQGDDSIVGTDAGDSIWGGGGRNTLVGGKGDDYFVIFDGNGAYDVQNDYEAGDGSIDGGEGRDAIYFSNSSGGAGTANSLTLDMQAGTADLAAGSGAPAHHITFTSIEFVVGGGGNDTMYGSAAGEKLTGEAGSDSIFGRAGDDTISGSGFSNGDARDSNYLRGDEGNDSIGGFDNAFNDINGNMGDDTCTGGSNTDWVVGGKDQDELDGWWGDDIVYGNMGDDTCDGGYDDDIVRGGQGNDIVKGNQGDDWLSGDRGDDTVTGGDGADIFHSFGDAGIDRVTDFNRAEGDRVMLDPGTTYTVAQQGADVVVAMGGGAQMVLVNVQLSSLTGDWIFGA